MTTDEKRELANEILDLFKKGLNSPNDIKRTGGTDHPCVLENVQGTNTFSWTAPSQSASNRVSTDPIWACLNALNNLLYENRGCGLDDHSVERVSVIATVVERLLDQSPKARSLFVNRGGLHALQDQVYILTNKEAAAHRIHRAVAELSTHIAEAKEMGLKIQLGVNQKDGNGKVVPLQAVITEIKTYEP